MKLSRIFDYTRIFGSFIPYVLLQYIFYKN